LLAAGRVPLSYNLRNLRVRWKTTLVTGLAFTLVVFATMAMLAFVNGMKRLMESSGNEGNVLVMSDGADDELMSNLPSSVRIETLPSELQDQIEKSGKDFLASFEVYVVTNQARPLAGEGTSSRFVQVRGLKDPEISARVHDIELLDGRWFALTGEYEVVLGEGIAGVLGADLGRGPLRPGDRFELGPLKDTKKVTVAGIMRSAGSTFNSEVWARDTVVQNEFGRVNSYTTIAVRTRDGKAARAAAVALKNTKGADVATVKAVTEREYYAKLSNTNVAFTIVSIIIAVVMAVGGVLGVMNTMYAAISQRSKDVGILRLLGYSRGQVLVSFLLESILIALAGGVVGCALGLLVNGVTMSGIATSGTGSSKSIVLKLVVDGNLLATGLLFTLVMGTVGGLLPSLSAMRLRPLESLR
jgi:ABC-type lipoprotein release transport system permease subunit